MVVSLLLSGTSGSEESVSIVASKLAKFPLAGPEMGGKGPQEEGKEGGRRMGNPPQRKLQLLFKDLLLFSSVNRFLCPGSLSN